MRSRARVAPAETGPTRTLFEDESFPACDASIDGIDDTARRSVDWARPSAWTLDPWLHTTGGILFSGGGGVPSPSRVRQGALGDCYLLAALAVIAERPDVARRLFPAPYDIRTGSIDVALYHNGVPRVVAIDDRLPVHLVDDPDTGRVCELIYARSTDANELWVPFVEKAYAKIYGSYDALVGGDIAEALRDLTGAAVLELQLQRTASDAAFVEMERRHRDGELLACGWCGDDAAATTYLASALAKRTGVRPNHAYAILDVRAIHSKRHGEKRWVRLRDPYGKHDRLGAIAIAAGGDAPRPHGEAACEQGEFWLPWEDFIRAFSTVYVALVGDVATTSDAVHNDVVHDAWCTEEQTTTTTKPGVDTYSAPIVTTRSVEIGCDGGCSGFSRWRANPQFAIRIPPRAADRTALKGLVITISQPDGRALSRTARRAPGLERAPLGYENKIGVEVVRLIDRHSRSAADNADGGGADPSGNAVDAGSSGASRTKTKRTSSATLRRAAMSSPEGGGTTRTVVNGAYEVVAKTPFWNKREVSLEVPCAEAAAGASKLGDAGALVAIVSCFYPGKTGPFRITLTATMSNESATPPTLVPRLNAGIGGDASTASIGAEWNGEFGALFSELPQFRLTLGPRPLPPMSSSSKKTKAQAQARLQPPKLVVFLRQREIERSVMVPTPERATIGLSLIEEHSAMGRKPLLQPPMTNALEVALAHTLSAPPTTARSGDGSSVSSVLCIVPTTTVTHRGFNGPPNFVISVISELPILSLEAVSPVDKRGASLDADKLENAKTAEKAAALKKGKKGKQRGGLTQRKMSRASATAKGMAKMYGGLV